MQLLRTTPDAEAQQALSNATRFLTLYSNVRHDAEANANGVMPCQRHARTVIIFPILIPFALSMRAYCIQSFICK